MQNNIHIHFVKTDLIPSLSSTKEAVSMHQLESFSKQQEGQDEIQHTKQLGAPIFGAGGAAPPLFSSMGDWDGARSTLYTELLLKFMAISNILIL